MTTTGSTSIETTTLKQTTAEGPITGPVVTTPTPTAAPQILNTTTSQTTITSTPVPSTTPCVCIYNGKTFHPGDLVYNASDAEGYCYTAYCEASCAIKKEGHACPTTPAPPTTTSVTTPERELTTTSVPTTSVPTTLSGDCTNVNPPRKNGESWKVNDNCTTATCVDGHITTTAHACPTAEPPVCANSRPPLKVYDASGCCFQYQCECVCSSWSGSHFVTFDGTTYTFADECSYYLVKELIPKYNLSIVLNNHYFSGPPGSDFYPQALVIHYSSYSIVLTQIQSSGKTSFAVYIDGKRIYPAYSNSALSLSSTDMAVTLEIPALKVLVVYRNNSFSIDLPYTLFGGRTEGQCGTCDNQQSNDCRGPNGHVGSCSSTAAKWLVPGTPCVTPTSQPPTTTTPSPHFTTPPSPPTTAQPVCPICTILEGSVFEPCHAVVSPAPYVAACKSDACGNNTCSSLEAYASECSNKGVCINWRNSTNGQCEHTCSDNKVYMSCGPAVEPTCNSRYNKKFTSPSNTKEGCFCPAGTTLFSSVYDTCVKSCDCVGPDGKPKQPGDSWTSACQQCVCDSDSMGVQCEPLPCPTLPDVTCGKPGQHLVNKTDGCCTVLSCECDVSLCPTAPPSSQCQPGFQLNVTVANGSCCPLYKCVPKGVCVYRGIEYPPGSKIPSDTNVRSRSVLTQCLNCDCTDKIGSDGLYTTTCTPVECNTTCAEGYTYQTVPGQCCGSCVQTSCVITLTDGTTHTLQVNETWSPPGVTCVKYSCVLTNGKPTTKETQTTCPPFNPLDCQPGTETTDASGCCKSCKVRSVCEVQKKQTVIEKNGCKSPQPVDISYCAGQCGSASMYSAAANQMMHQCECCQEVSTSQKDVQLTCADGSVTTTTYVTVESCGCRLSECVPAGVTPAPPAAAQRQRRRRR